MKVKKLIKQIESVAPLSLQEHWDNSGLQIGNNEQDVHSVLLCTDITEPILQEAIAKHCQLIISHHPLLFHGLKTIQGNTPQERCAILAIQNNISLYSSHTAMDVYVHGVSGHIAEKLGITQYTILSPTQPEHGLGVIGNLPQPTDFHDLLQQIGTTFHVPSLRYTQPQQPKVQRIAICGGAGSEFLEAAIEQQADVYLSADFKYHEFCSANARIAVIDMGHFESEQFTKEIFAELLKPFQPQIDILFADNDQSPVLHFITSSNTMN